jgi:uncharacterized membrane protein YhaH (DUF805 family)
MDRSELSVNRSIFTPGGILGRLDFIKVLLKTFLLFLGGGLFFGVPFYILGRIYPTLQLLFFLYLVVALIFGTYFNYINAFKRLRDILGSTSGQLLWQTGFVFLSWIPGIGVFAVLFLFMMPGLVTSPNQKFGFK